MGAKEARVVAVVVRLYESWGSDYIVSIGCFFIIGLFMGVIYNIWYYLRKGKMNQMRKGLQISNYLLFNNTHRFCQSPT